MGEGLRAELEEEVEMVIGGGQFEEEVAQIGVQGQGEFFW